MDDEQRTQIALFRVGVLGPLVSAELEHGDLTRLCQQAAERTWRMPDGRTVSLQARTVEDWHYAYRSGGLQALKPKGRSDVGTSRAIPPELADRLLALKRENPRRSIRRLVRMLERAGEVRPGRLKRSTVHRLLSAHGQSRRPPRSEGRTERRAFRHAHAGDCWMGDVMHGPKVVDRHGRVRKAYLHAFVDSATRLVPGCAFRLGERAVDLEAVLKMAVRGHGVPKILYVDNGSAQTAGSLRLICAELGVRLRHCRPYDPAAKGAVERFFRTFRAEVVDELGDEPLQLGELNGRAWAWLSTEYHRREHGGTGQAPLSHWLEQADRLRPAPPAAELDRLFLHLRTRRVRRDGTVRFEGRLLEVRGELAGDTVELRHDPEIDFDADDPATWPKAYVDGRFACDTVVLDVIANSARRRRTLPSSPRAADDAAPTGIDPLQQMADEQTRRTARPAHPDHDHDDKE